MRKTVPWWLAAMAMLVIGYGCGGGGGGGGGGGSETSNSGDATSGGSSGGSTPSSTGTTPSSTPTVLNGNYALTAWNDLGMHCIDGKDYSVMSILPPYNNLHAQLVDRSNNQLVTSGVALTYAATADLNGSINTGSASKTNFWQYVGTLYGALFGGTPASNVGLTGNPAPSNTPAPLAFNSAQGWFEADAIPITPTDDSGSKNYYPMVQVVAKDTSGNTLAGAKVVLPVSDEMTCKACHASRQTGNAAQLAAQPGAGWAFDADPEKDWKKNILRIHDDKQFGNATFQQASVQKGYGNASLAASAAAGKPVLCADCHASNALPGSGVAGVPPLTTAQHSSHSQVIDPTQGVKLDNVGNRSACYLCHPGAVTQCLRGAMGKAVDSSGNALMSCQSCHGAMSAVGSASRTGWLQEPNCQACHHDGNRETSAIDSTTGALRQVTDARFATSANAPSTGFSLYRFSTGHGNLQCEACHGATHAVYPSAENNDNVLSVGLQGHRGTVGECTTCHATVPSTTTGGPHGMHSPTQKWVSSHGDTAERNRTQCAYCHGSDYKGTYLSEVRTARTFSANNKTVTFAPGRRVGCYDCHNGPGGEGQGGTVAPNMNPAYTGTAGAAMAQEDASILTWLTGP
jgi:hypothetical protein